MGKNRRRKPITVEQNTHSSSPTRLGQLERPAQNTQNRQSDGRQRAERNERRDARVVGAQAPQARRPTPQHAPAAPAVVPASTPVPPSDGAKPALTPSSTPPTALYEVTILPEMAEEAGSPADDSVSLAFEATPIETEATTSPPVSSTRSTEPVERLSDEAGNEISGDPVTKSKASSSVSSRTSGMPDALAHAPLAYDSGNTRTPNEPSESVERDTSNRAFYEAPARTDVDPLEVTAAASHGAARAVEIPGVSASALTMEEVSVTHPRTPRDLAVGGEPLATAYTFTAPVDTGDVGLADEAATDERPTVIITNDGPNTLAEFSLLDDPPNTSASGAHPVEMREEEADVDPHITNPSGLPTRTGGRMQRPARQLRSSGNPSPSAAAPANEQIISDVSSEEVTLKASANARHTPRIASDPTLSDAAPMPEAPVYPPPPAPVAYTPQPPQPAQPAHHIPQPAGAWPQQHAHGGYGQQPGPMGHAGQPMGHQGHVYQQRPQQGQFPPQPPQQRQHWPTPPPALMGTPLSPLVAPTPAAGSPPLVAQGVPGAQKPSHAPWAVADSWGESTFNGPNTAAGLSYLFGWVSGLIVYFGERQNRYVRFHAAQSVLLTGALTILGVILFTMLQLFDDVATTTHQMMYMHIGEGIALLGLVIMLIVWFTPMIAAWNGIYLRIPVFADYAERYAAPPREIYPE